MISINNELISMIEDYNPENKPISSAGRKEEDEILKTVFSEELQNKFTVIEFFNHYLINNAILKVIITGYDCLKLIRKSYVWAFKSKSLTEDDFLMINLTETIEQGNDITDEEFNWIINELKNESTNEEIWSQKDKLLNVLHLASEKYLKAENYRVYQKFQNWYNIVSDIMDQPLLESENPKKKKKSNDNSKIVKLLSLDDPELCRKKLRYSYITGILMGVNPDILLVIILIEGILLLKSLRTRII